MGNCLECQSCNGPCCDFSGCFEKRSSHVNERLTSVTETRSSDSKKLCPCCFGKRGSGGREYIPLYPFTSIFSDDDDEKNTNVLKIKEVDLHFRSNGEAHHTMRYDLMFRDDNRRLVVRRGQEFFITLYTNRPYDKDNDAISFVFTAEDGKASMGHGTLVLVPLLAKTHSSYGSFNYNPNSWTAYIADMDDEKVRVQIKTSSTSSIGKWKVAIDTKLKDTSSAVTSTIDGSLYILFNPWHPDDQVYLEGEEARKEYVLEDVGIIWRGSHNRLRRTPWTYSQFEKDVLDCALYVLSGPGSLAPSARADAIKVARKLSAVVNSEDENGIVRGNWTEDFSGGTKPSKWTGSLKIIQKYYSTKKPVKFGQCWVFSGVLTSICRALGIPCRPITNYSSAHDTQSSLTVDYFLDEEGKPVESLNTDSVWNFHVWNEVWIDRPDIKAETSNHIDDDEFNSNELEETNKWQVIDSTPQEQSDGIFRCGPAPVVAAKKGEIYRPYDTAFLYSEVNADKVYWHYRGQHKPLKLLGKKDDVIGKLISTKAISTFEREDVTATYKYPEKTKAERDVMLFALKFSDSLFSRYYLNEDFNDVRFDLELIDDILIGSDFRVLLKITNFSEEKDYNVKATLRVDAVTYTGRRAHTIKKQEMSIKIASYSEEEITVLVTFDEYYSKLCDQCSFSVACLAKVDENDFEYFAQDDFRVRKPDIRFKMEKKESIVVGEPLRGKVILTNPLPIPLTRGKFDIDGAGLGETIKKKLKSDVKPGEIAEAMFEFVPKTSGEKTISAKFTSKELEDVDGFVKINVEMSNEILEYS